MLLQQVVVKADKDLTLLSACRAAAAPHEPGSKLDWNIVMSSASLVVGKRQ